MDQNTPDESTGLLPSEVAQTEQIEDQLVLDTPKPVENEREKSILLIALLICSFVAQTLYLNVAVLVPIFVADTFPTIDAVKVGALMAIFPIAYLVSAPLVGSMLTKHGRKSAVIGGVILMTVSTVIFALAGKLKNPTRFYWVSFLARLVQGVADAVVGVVIQAIIVLEFPEN
jgi:DHA1 family multidrug resistance protein-like MFS transporter